MNGEARVIGWRRAIPVLVRLLMAAGLSLPATGADDVARPLAKGAGTRPLAAVLSPAKWQQVENAVDRALAWIASQQLTDGSFPTVDSGQPAVTRSASTCPTDLHSSSPRNSTLTSRTRGGPSVSTSRVMAKEPARA